MAQKEKRSSDSRLKPMPGAEPYRYHDRILYSPLDNPKTFRHAKRGGLRTQRTSVRTRRGRKTTRA